MSTIKYQCLFCVKQFAPSDSPAFKGIKGSQNCNALEDQLLQHFVLMHLLDIPKSWCEEALTKYYEPKTIKMCDSCSHEVNEAWNVYQKLIPLEIAMKTRKEILKKVMLEGIGKIQRARKKKEISLESDIRCLLFPDEMTFPFKRPTMEEIKIETETIEEASVSEDCFGDVDNSKRRRRNRFPINTDEFEVEIGPEFDEMYMPEDCLDDDGDDCLDEFINAPKKRRTSSKKQKTKISTIRRIKGKYIKGKKSHFAPTFQCHLCPTKFKETEELQNHVVAHEESKRDGLECETCNFPARTSHELELHKFHEHENDIGKFKRKYACGKCEFKSAIWKELKNHAEKEHADVPLEELGLDVQLKCGSCPKVFESPSHFFNHQKKMHPELFGAQLETIQCDQCPALFPSKIHLQYHIKAAHKRLNKFVCELCAKGFARKRSLDRHKVTHEDKQDFVCHLCASVFSYQSTLDSHNKKFHPDDSQPLPNNKTSTEYQEEFNCKYCYVKFSLKLDWIKHMKSHKQIKCEKCNKMYVTPQSLKQHMRLNHPTTNQQVSCPHCHQVYPNSHSMRTHVTRYCRLRKQEKNDQGESSLDTSQAIHPTSQPDKIIIPDPSNLIPTPVLVPVTFQKS